MTPLLGETTAVLMAKDPAAGGAKTRLLGAHPPEAASAVAEAMLRCTALRLRAAAARLVLAATPDGSGAELAARLGLGDVTVVDQGGGSLGDRLDRVWQAVGADRPVAFFGGDSPDVPAAALAALGRALRRCDVALGPTGDGGYWTLAARSHLPALLHGVDWGGAEVYDQTLRRARAAGLLVARLPAWHDVDRPADLEALRLRLRRGAARLSESDPLRWLAEQLDRLCASVSPPRGTPP